MDKKSELVYIHVWLAAFIFLCISFIRGKGLERAYRVRMKWTPSLMPGRMKDKEFFVKTNKFFAKIILAFGIVIYLLALHAIITGRF